MNDASPELVRAARILARSRSLLVLTGAGISAESGVPTYRGPGGLYERDPSLLSRLTAEGFRREPRAVWEHVDEIRRVVAGVSPNRAHEVLARWEREGRFEKFLIATQNVDGLHQAAGSDRVAELHGSVWKLSRPRPPDSDPEDLSAWFRSEDPEASIRRWSEDDGGIVTEDREVPFRAIPPSPEPGLRPHVVLFDEMYGNRLLWTEWFVDRGVDAALVVGCSGGVTVLYSLLGRLRARNPDAKIVNVNPHEDCLDVEHVFVRAGAGEALAALDAALAGGVDA